VQVLTYRRGGKSATMKRTFVRKDWSPDKEQRLPAPIPSPSSHRKVQSKRPAPPALNPPQTSPAGDAATPMEPFGAAQGLATSPELDAPPQSVEAKAAAAASSDALFAPVETASSPNGTEAEASSSSLRQRRPSKSSTQPTEAGTSTQQPRPQAEGPSEWSASGVTATSGLAANISTAPSGGTAVGHAQQERQDSPLVSTAVVTVAVILLVLALLWSLQYRSV
jgi:hypothetical protein